MPRGGCDASTYRRAVHSPQPHRDRGRARATIDAAAVTAAVFTAITATVAAAAVTSAPFSTAFAAATLSTAAVATCPRTAALAAAALAADAHHATTCAAGGAPGPTATEPAREPCELRQPVRRLKLPGLQGRAHVRLPHQPRLRLHRLLRPRVPLGAATGSATVAPTAAARHSAAARAAVAAVAAAALSTAAVASAAVASTAVAPTGCPTTTGKPTVAGLAGQLRQRMCRADLRRTLRRP